MSKAVVSSQVLAPIICGAKITCSMNDAHFVSLHRRLLKKGSIIISAPLLATWGQSMFEIETDGIHQKGLADINNISLFLNYQFSHPDSNVFFFPINQAIVINHNSDRRKGGKRPNAKLDWATWNQKSTYYLARPLEDLENVSIVYSK